jgi:hypothetical protein
MGNNNFSRKYCSEIAMKNSWDKDAMRNVVSINEEKWSVTLAKTDKAECRQTYDDCVGFITIDPTSMIAQQYRVNKLNDFSVSRISPSGKKAYNVVLDVNQGINIPCQF